MNKTVVLQARVTAEKKSIIKQAAQILGTSVSDLLVSSAYEKATSVVQKHTFLELSTAASIQFAEALEKTETVTPDFQRGAERYVATMNNSDE